VLRFEDLDATAVRREYYDSQRRDLEALGIDWDEELVQSEHLERYREAIEDLVRRGLTYECFCSRREIREAAAAPHIDLPEGAYPGTCRRITASMRRSRLDAGDAWALRLRTDGSARTFVDRLAGPVVGRLDDQILARRDAVPAYNLVVVLDDRHQGVEEVVRGDDLITSTPRQIHIAELFGMEPPRYTHVPLVLGPRGERLAKRDGAVTLADRLALGETPSRVRGLIASSLGLADDHADEPTPGELLERFDPEALPRRPWRLSQSELGA
jgi:glutamyl-tRNA synthetase